jgi:predicted RNase H-like HicB family nuclease
METKLKMVYWKGKKYWVGRLLEHPEIMTQGETLEELEENMKDAYLLMAMHDVPEEHKIKKPTLTDGHRNPWRGNFLLDIHMIGCYNVCGKGSLCV